MSIRAALVWLVAGVAACAGTSEPRSPAGIHVISGGNVTDTVLTALSAPLLVEVHDDHGGPVPDATIVRFTVVSDAPAFASGVIGAFNSPSFSSFVAAEPDASGRTGVFVHFGTRAGTFKVLIEVPTLGFRDSVRYTVTAGAPARLTAAPVDTAVYVSHSYTLSGTVTDQWGNPRTDPVTWSASDNGISVSSGGVVTGTAIGRYTISASAGGKAGIATVSVSILPQGEVVGVEQGSRLVAVGLDGSNRRTLTNVADGGIGVHPRWIPGTNRVVYTTVVSGLQTLFTVDVSGVAQQFFASTPTGITHQAEPTPSADGQWLYFIAYDTACQYEEYCLHRSKIDGTAVEQLGSIATTSFRTWQPAPSPDGSKAAFVIGSSTRLMNAQARTAAPESYNGNHPAWSPTGDLIAMNGESIDPIRVMNADGTGLHVLSTSGRTYFGYLTWTSDGKWLLAQSVQTGRYELVNATTGVALPLPQLGLASMAVR